MGTPFEVTLRELLRSPMAKRVRSCHHLTLGATAERAGDGGKGRSMADVDVLTETITVDEIDGDYVPRRREGVVEVEVDSDLVVIAGRMGQTHTLNPTAALVWSCLDGDVTLDQLIVELADATGAPEPVIRDDVLALTRDLGMRGLLVGVVPPVPESTYVAPEALAVGDVLEDATLSNLDGVPTAISSLLDRQVLLVNWSPGCGYCVKIAAELGELEAALDANGVTLAFVTSGDAEANRQVFDEAGLSAPALLKDEADPFAGFGTPAAYLLDADGTVVVPMAYGAAEVPVLARELAGVAEPEADHDHGTHDHETHDHAHSDGTAEGSAVKYLPSSSGVCGPGGGGGGAANSTEWVGTRAFAIGEYHIGIRYNSEFTADVLDRLFPGQRVHDPKAPDSFSVALFSPATRQSRELNLLVHGSSQAVRSRSLARVLHALLLHLSAVVASPDPRQISLGATAAVRKGEGLLLPPGIVQWIKQLQPRLSRRGIQLVDVPLVTVDPMTAELVVPEPTLSYDASVLDDIDEGVKLGSELPAVLPGRYPLRMWHLVVAEDQLGPLSPSIGFSAAISQVALADADADLAETAQRLLGLTRQVETRGIWYSSVDELATLVGAAV
jgi:thiol-disulfide isomerase/thioredoxin